ncbi:GP179 protein, partial [Rhinopomastus cyanomelas]|nr:GP179 protein [Rhinopomastus cyanomelas]
SIDPQGHAEEEQPHVKPTADSVHPPTTGELRPERPEAAVYPWGAPAGRGPLLRQEAVASRDDSGVPLGEEIPAKVLEKGGSQPQPLSSRGTQDTESVPRRSWSTDVVPAVVGKAGRVVGRQEKVCPGETQADPSIKLEICPWEESGGQGKGLEKDGREDGLHHSREEPDVKKPPGKAPELLEVALEKAENVEGRRAEVCPWEAGDGAQPEHEGQWESSSPGKSEEQPSTDNPPALPKPSSKQTGTIDSKKAAICPWEVEGETLAKTNICPWEEPAASWGKQRVSQDTQGTSKGERNLGSGGLD